ncbi:MAG: preprotein translocase subunit YajC [Eubacterium sp.]|nr:preprotein translocase subunit YajC [Eubacterium sp.]
MSTALSTVLLDSSSSGGSSMIMLVVWVVLIFGMLYFMMIRPQKKEQAKKEQMMNSIEVGDTVLTTSGFYGTVVDIQEDMVIVEFGSNRNCRIPMQRAAVADVEKPIDSTKVVETKADKKSKKKDDK